MIATVRPVTVEHHREPLGIGQPRPRLSWVVDTTVPGWAQRAYEIEISSGGSSITTGRIDSVDQVLVPWPGDALPSRARCEVRVRVWGPDADPSPWSRPTALEIGLLDPDLWTVKMVAPPLRSAGSDGEPAMLLRGTTRVDGDIVHARVRATAYGVMTLTLNGVPVGDDVLHPGWTSYAKRLRYRTWDVTDLVQPGENTFGVQLADGWFRGFLGFGGLRDLYGDQTGVLVQLEVEHRDGSLSIVGTDETWRASEGPITRADLYMGETFDAHRVQPGWDLKGFDDTSWTAVTETPFEPATLIAPDGPPVRRMETLSPVSVGESPSGRTLLDFGQNIVGRLRVDVPPGEGTITLRHAEVLEDGELGVRPLRAARATDEIILNGSAFIWEPEFTIHGFRYAEVTGWPGDIDPSAVEAVVIHTDLRRTGTFDASDPLLARLHENVVWGMRGNFLDVPTDCPQRDERLGWTGDLMAFAPTASYLFDTAGMLTGWLADLAVDQHPDGVVPIYIPWAEVDPNLPPLGAEAGWGDAATIVPWTIYQRHGDAEILSRQWSSMTRWVDALSTRAGAGMDFPEGGFSFGDWLDAAAPDDQPWAARLPWQAVATAYLAHSAGIVRDAARVLDDQDVVARYSELFDRAAEKYRAEYLTPSGRAAFPSQTAYGLAIRFGLLLPRQRNHAGSLLAAQVAADGFHIGSGFLGTPHICDALADTGHADAAWKLLLQRESPSWLFAVTMGATTIWERWNSMLPDGSINPGEMTSFNHYALGSIADFLHRRVGGLAPAAPGYRRLRVAPLPTPELTWVRTTHETPYGRAAVAWRLDGEDFTLDVDVPPSTQAEIHLPDGSDSTLAGPGTHRFFCRVTWAHHV